MSDDDPVVIPGQMDVFEVIEEVKKEKRSDAKLLCDCPMHDPKPMTAAEVVAARLKGTR